MAGQHLAHRFDQFLLGDGELRFGLLLQMLLAALFQLRQLGADDQVLDGDFALGLLVGALDDDARRVALVGVFHLRAEFSRIAEIKLGADVGRAQLGDHVLVIGEAILVEHGDDDRAGLGLALELAEVLQRGGEPRHADGKSGRRHRLAAKARDQPVITPARSNGAEAHRLSVVTRNGECQVNFEDRAGVIFEAADDGGIDKYATVTGNPPSATKRAMCRQFFKTHLTGRAKLNATLDPIDGLVILKIRTFDSVPL